MMSILASRASCKHVHYTLLSATVLFDMSLRMRSINVLIHRVPAFLPFPKLLSPLCLVGSAYGARRYHSVLVCVRCSDVTLISVGFLLAGYAPELFLLAGYALELFLVALPCGIVITNEPLKLTSNFMNRIMRLNDYSKRWWVRPSKTPINPNLAMRTVGPYRRPILERVNRLPAPRTGLENDLNFSWVDTTLARLDSESACVQSGHNQLIGEAQAPLRISIPDPQGPPLGLYWYYWHITRSCYLLLDDRRGHLAFQAISDD